MTFLPQINIALDGEPILTIEQIDLLRASLAGRIIALCFGAGVDSTAMLVALRSAGIRPDVITFADTGGEKPPTLLHVDRMNEVLAGWGWPLIETCRKVPLAKTGYTDLYGNCLKNETLPSLAFGMKSCSIKWKTNAQDLLLKGARSGPSARPPHPVWQRACEMGQTIVKLIGYDAGKADMRRARNMSANADGFEYQYPLQLLGWTRPDCVKAITRSLGAHLVPIKSACFFCPASKHWELYWLAAHYPEQLEDALVLERVALTGRHSRFDTVEFGATWEEMVRNADRFPSTKTTVGLGRSFAWNQWARVNGVVDGDFRVIRSKREHFIAMADMLRGDDNALDRRSCGDDAPAAEQPSSFVGFMSLEEAFA